MCKREPPKASHLLLINPLNNRVVGSFTGLNSGALDAQQGATERSDPASGALMTATCCPFDFRVSISNGYLQSSGRGQVSTGRVLCSPDTYAEKVAKHSHTER